MVYCIVPNKTKKFSEGRSNRDGKVRIHEIEACCPHTRVDTRFDGTIGFHFEMGYQEKHIQDRKIYNWFSYPQFSWELRKDGSKNLEIEKDHEPSLAPFKIKD